ncbi:MAG: hypothetical protein V3V15_01995 [Sphingorhabdus sp.]
MRARIIAFTVSLLALAACSPAEQAKPDADAVETESATNVYVNIRKLAGEGDITAAAKLTDDPESYTAQMTIAVERLGEERFQQNMKNATLKSNIHGEKVAGDHAMVIVNFTINGVNDKAANFFRKSGDSYVEIVAPNDSIPCKLVREFYVAKGDKDAEIGNCSE